MSDGKPEIFASYTGGIYSHIVTEFLRALKDGLDHTIADWLRKPHVSGDLTEKLHMQLSQCRVFIPFITQDFECKIANEEINWLVEKCNNDPDFRQDLLVIPIILSESSVVIWKKMKIKFHERIRNSVFHECFDDKGRCNVINRNENNVAFFNTDYGDLIKSLQEDISLKLSSPRETNCGLGDCEDKDDSGGETDVSNRPKIFVFGGAEWELSDSVNIERRKLISQVLSELPTELQTSLIDVGDQWGLMRNRLDNLHLFRSGGKVHSILVGDNVLLDALREDARTGGSRYSHVLSAEIDQNLHESLGWEIKERLIWLPPSLEENDSCLVDGQTLGPFTVARGGVDVMVDVMQSIFGLTPTTAILYQDPGENFEDIAKWTLTRFAETVDLKQPKVEAEIFRNKLKDQLSERLQDGDERFIMMVCDGTINVPKGTRKATRQQFDDRLRSVEKEIRLAVEEVYGASETTKKPRFARVFLQYRHPAFTFEDLIPNPFNPSMKWTPVRFKDLETPCEDCLDSLRDEVQRVCE